MSEIAWPMGTNFEPSDRRVTRRAPFVGQPLFQGDYEELKKSGINPAVANAALLRRVSDAEARLAIGYKGSGDCAGLIFPYYLPGEDTPSIYRIRRDNPDWETRSDGTPRLVRKYLGAVGESNRAYFPPGTSTEILTDHRAPVFIVEGEKKALALTRLMAEELTMPRSLVIGIPGVWAWKGKTGMAPGPNGERIPIKGLIPDLTLVKWQERRVYIIFDTNVHTNEDVARARTFLVKELQRRGAEVYIVDLPKECGVNGVDDLLAARGSEYVLELIKNARPAKKPKMSQAERLLIIAESARYYHSPDGRLYARIQVHGHWETILIDSPDFSSWLTGQFYAAVRKAPNAAALREAISACAAKARFESPEEPLFVRVAEKGGRIYIDLANAAWQAIEIGKDGWRVVENPPVHFVRPRSARSLPVPTQGGSIDLLRRFINIGEQSNWILLTAWLLGAIRPSGPYPILILQGEQGSAKSTTARFLRLLLDPCISLLRSLPKDERDLVIAAANSRVLAFDNVSKIPDWLSDALCRLATGGGFATRKLFTDRDEEVFDVTRPVILNGITYLPQRPDLSERAVVLNVPPITSEKRATESFLLAEFDGNLPSILGAFFSVVSAALAKLDSIQLERLPRMADFARFAIAAEPALGFREGAFLAAYEGNQTNSIEENLDGDSVAGAIMTLLAQLGSDGLFTGTCKDLLRSLNELVDEGVRKAGDWPMSERALRERLTRLAPFARRVGIEVELPRRASKGRRVLRLKKTALTATSVTPINEGYVSRDAFGTSGGDGAESEVAVDPIPTSMPSPQIIHAKSLNDGGIPTEVTEVPIHPEDLENINDYRSDTEEFESFSL